MRTVSRFEANLLQIVRLFVGKAPLATTLRLIVEELEHPPCLSRDCVELIQQYLSKGIVHRYARRRGWRNERYLRGGKITNGRLWQRTEPTALGLEFSGHSIEFLMWLTAKNPLESHWEPTQLQPLKLGDLFLLFLAYEALRETQVNQQWVKQDAFTQHGLCLLMFPDDFASRAESPKPDFEPWLTERGSLVLECLQSDLADRWTALERDKGRIVAPKRMLRIGQIQELVLGLYLQRLEQEQRQDLARFLLVAGRRLLTGSTKSAEWTRSLDLTGQRMADRGETYGAALATLRQLQTLAQWQAKAVNIGYFDEAYEASQLWKADWEEFRGEELVESAAAISREIDPLATGGHSVPNSSE